MTVFLWNFEVVDNPPRISRGSDIIPFEDAISAFFFDFPPGHDEDCDLDSQNHYDNYYQ